MCLTKDNNYCILRKVVLQKLAIKKREVGNEQIQICIGLRFRRLLSW